MGFMERAQLGLSASASIPRSAFDRAFSHRHIIYWISSFILSSGRRLNLFLVEPEENNGKRSKIAPMMTSHAKQSCSFAVKTVLSSLLAIF
jgi:hypothetical protein